MTSKSNNIYMHIFKLQNFTNKLTINMTINVITQ